jgi:hypothetical protein
MQVIRRRVRPPAVLALAFLALAALYALATPLYESTDELRHFRYVRSLQAHRALPEQTADPARNAQAHHPPVYYMAAALASAWAPGLDEEPVYFDLPINPFWGYRYFDASADNKAQYLHGPAEAWPFRGNTAAAWLSRLVTIAFGFGTVLITYQLGLAAFPGRKALAAGAAAFVALNPNFLHLAASINNDVPAAFFGAGALLASARIWRAGNSARRALGLGLALALGMMTKTNAIALLPAGLLAIGLAARREGRWRSGWQAIAIVGACLAVLGGWWFARNAALYGDLTGTADYVAVWRGEADRARLFREMISNLPYAWTTVWGRFGYGQVPLSDTLYLAAGVLAAVAAAGLAPFARVGMGRPGDWPMWLILALAVAGASAAWVALMLTIPATANARMMFAAYPALGLFLAAGVSGWGALAARWRSSPTSGGAVAIAILAAAMCAFAVAAWATALRPAFAPPRPLPPEAARANASPAGVSVGGVAEIVGYRASAPAAKPGEAVSLTVYWKVLAQTATPYTVFVHLIDNEGIPTAQRHTYPGLGNYPTQWWEPGRVFADTYRVDLPETAYAPGQGEWRVGLFDLATGSRLEAFDIATGQSIGDAASLGGLAVAARPGPAPNSVHLNFGGRIELLGYELDRRTLAPGEALQVTAYWQALAPDADYWAFAHAVAVDGSIWAISDSAILPPVTAWTQGEIVAETRSLTLAPDAPPGLYEVYLGVTRVDENGQSRLRLLAADGHELDDKVALTRIRVRPAEGD